MISILRWSMLLATMVLLGGCSNANCNNQIRARLLTDCKATFGISNTVCLSLSGAPSYSDPDNPPPEIERFREKSCAISDPRGTQDCYLTSSCDDVLSGKCDDRDFSQAVVSCIQTNCTSQTLNGCSQACAMRADYDNCSSCILDCQQADTDCRETCVSKG